MPPSPRTPSLKGQVLTCLLFVTAAMVITALMHTNRGFAEWHIGQPVLTQLLVAAAFATVSSAGVAVTLTIPALAKRVPVPSAVQALDLSGATPWIVGLCAGVGEELLLRAALQPLLGLWLGAVLFAAAHARTAMIGSQSHAKRVAYLLNVFAAGVALGLVFEYLGLIAAILIHATIDVAGLVVFRSLAARRAVPSAA